MVKGYQCDSTLGRFQFVTAEVPDRHANGPRSALIFVSNGACERDRPGTSPWRHPLDTAAQKLQV